MGVSCKNCGGTDLDHDPARGNSVCMSCGSVVENLCIVNEVEFQENAAGNASVIGQFVSAESQHTSLGPNFKYGVGRDHRQVILDNGRHLIQSMGGLLKMSSHCLDSAYMFYKMAVSKRFTCGRKTVYVIGACLYLVSRTEKTPHMLLDICDVVQCDVVSLGRVFLQLARELCIECPIVDPSLYIHRFAHQLDFGDKENDVSMAALRIMARMKKDWIHLGRRPSALCGAALIIAAKLFNFNVTMNDIVKLVRMSKTTVFKRLMDFGKTATGKLTTEEFKTVDLEEEADPPCYIDGRNRLKFAQEYGDQCKFVNSDVLSQVVRTQGKLEILLDKRKSIRSEIDVTVDESKEFDYRSELPQDYSLYNYELDENGEFKISKHIIDEDDDVEISNKEEVLSKVEDRKPITTASSTLLLDLSSNKLKEETSSIKDASINDNDEIDLTDINDDEIDKLLLTEDEIRIKTEVWLNENREYLQKMKEKEEEKRLKEEEEAKNGTKKKRKHTKRKAKDKSMCGSADEAIKTMLFERKLSSKINYDVLRGLKSEDENKSLNKDDDEKKAVDMKIISDSRKSETISDLPVVYETGPLQPPAKKIKKESKTDVKPLIVPSLLSENQTETTKLEEEKKNIIVESSSLLHEDGEYDDDDVVEEDEEDTIRASSLFARQIDEYDDYGDYDDGDAFY